MQKTKTTLPDERRGGPTASSHRCGFAPPFLSTARFARHVPCWKAPVSRGAGRHQTAPAPRHPRSLPRWVLAAILLAVVVCAATATGIEQEEAGTRHVLVLIPEPGAETTVHQRIHFEPATADNRTMTIGVPLDSRNHEVTNSDQRRLAWSETAPGVLHVQTPQDTAYIDVSSRGILAPGNGQPLRFGQTDPADPLWLVVAAAPSLDASAFGLNEIAHDELQGSGAVPDSWPLPDSWGYAWNEGRDKELPPSIEPASGQLRSPLSAYALAAGVVVLLGALTLWLVARIHKGVGDPTRSRKQPIMRHLEELRKRLGVAVVVLFVATAFFFSFAFRWTTLAQVRLPVPWPTIHNNAASQVFTWLASRIVPAGVDVVVVAPFEAVITLLLLSFALGVLVTFPILFFETYAFLAPALYPPERRLVFAVSPAVVALFAAGAIFGLLVMAPLIVKVLYGFAVAAGAIAFLTMPQLVSIAALLALLFAVAFQMPLVMMLTARMGLVRAAVYRRQWRWAVIIIIVFSAMVTDPTVITQIIVAAVLLALYGIGLVLAWIADRKRIEPE